MILLINDSYHLWIPIYMFNATEYISPFLYSLLVFEFSISLFCVFYTLKLCSSIWRIRVFHVNMSILAIAYLIQYLECFIGKWFMIAAQFGFFPIQGLPSSKTYLNWWTSDPLSIPRVSNTQDILSLLIGGLFVWHYLFSMIGFIFSFCAERALATVLSGNYKRHRRTYISFTILFISHTVTLYLSYLTFTEQVEMVSTVVGCMICVTLSCVTFIIILIVNLKINEMQSKTGIFYTLAFRFQVKENIRALKLAYRILVCIGIYIFLLCIILFTLFFDVFPSLNLLLIFLLENCIYLNPLVICSVIFYSIDPWKKSLIPRGFIRSSTSHTSKSSIGRQQTTDLYFQQLQSSWLRK